MAHFDYTRPGGIWSGSDDFLTAEIEDLDSKTERAINGDEGGTWAPTDVITIGGDGLTVSGPFVASDCEGLTLTTGTLTVQSGAEINVDTGGGLVIAASGTFIAQASSVIDFESGCDLDIACNTEILSGGSIIFRSGSQMIAAVSVRPSGVVQRCLAPIMSPSSSTRAPTTSRPPSDTPLRLRAAAAAIAAASPLFMSALPRP